jgi:tetratricopeptide (TPR) repeat protein
LTFSAQDASVLLEKAIYTEETLGNLSDAINIYKQIIASADTSRTIGALALYRIGVCYRKYGNESGALEAFSSLAQLYPEQKDLIVKSLLLILKPAPWVDGEIMQLTQKKIGTEGAGPVFSTYSVESSMEGGKPVWTFLYHFGMGRPPIYYSVTVADARTMIPLVNRSLSNQTYLEARYAVDKIEVLNPKDSSEPAKQIAIPGTVYDAWQIVPLLRCLPLREGLRVTIPMFASSTGASANVKFTVVARETIAAPAGDFDCYKIVMSSDNNAPVNQIFWISADSHSYLVKAHIDDANAFELKSVEVVGKNQSANFTDPESGIGLSWPRQWYLSHVFNTVQARQFGLSAPVSDHRFGLSAPEFDSTLEVTVSAHKPELASGAQVTKVLTVASYQVPSYQVRPQTRERVTIAGLSGERFIVDVRDSTSGDPIVDYAYHLSSQTKSYTFTFRTRSDNFDKMKSVFETIVSSLKVQ